MSLASIPSHPSARDAPAAQGPRSQGYKFYELLLVGSVTVLVCSNLIGPGKSVRLGSLSFGAGNLFFPISYIFGDVLTEVYGYARARRAIWAGFGALAFAAIMGFVVIHLPPDPGEAYNRSLQPALALVFGNTWRITLASMLAFWVGDFVNSFVMAKMKLWTSGRYLWTRTIGSTMAGQLVDSAIFYPLSFIGIWSGHTLLTIMVGNWLFKVMIEVVFTPVTYAVVGGLKKAEKVDHFDGYTDFNPFKLET